MKDYLILDNDFEELALKYDTKAVQLLMTKISGFSCVPKRINSQHWCISCKRCWIEYLDYLLRQSKKI